MLENRLLDMVQGNGKWFWGGRGWDDSLASDHVNYLCKQVHSREDGFHGEDSHQKDTELSKKEREERERERDRKEERTLSAERGEPNSDYDSEEEEDIAVADLSSLRTFQRSDFQVIPP